MWSCIQSSRLGHKAQIYWRIPGLCINSRFGLQKLQLLLDRRCGFVCMCERHSYQAQALHLQVHETNLTRKPKLQNSSCCCPFGTLHDFTWFMIHDCHSSSMHLQTQPPSGLRWKGQRSAMQSHKSLCKWSTLTAPVPRLQCIEQWQPMWTPSCN